MWQRVPETQHHITEDAVESDRMWPLCSALPNTGELWVGSKVRVW